MSNVRDTRTLTPLLSAVVTRIHAGSCWPWKGPLDTNRWCRLEAPVAWWSTLDARMPSSRTFWKPACDTTGAVDSKRPLRKGAHWILIRLLCRLLGAGLRHNGCGKLETPVAWGSTLDTRTPSLWMCCELACNADSPLVELPVDFAFTWWQCRCDYIWSLLEGEYLYTGG
jgi:hypothetical protein